MKFLTYTVSARTCQTNGAVPGSYPVNFVGATVPAAEGLTEKEIAQHQTAFVVCKYIAVSLHLAVMSKADAQQVIRSLRRRYQTTIEWGKRDGLYNGRKFCRQIINFDHRRIHLGPSKAICDDVEPAKKIPWISLPGLSRTWVAYVLEAMLRTWMNR